MDIKKCKLFFNVDKTLNKILVVEIQLSRILFLLKVFHCPLSEMSNEITCKLNLQMFIENHSFIFKFQY